MCSNCSIASYFPERSRWCLIEPGVALCRIRTCLLFVEMPRKGLPVTPGPGAMKACVVSLVCLLGVVQCDAVEWTAETYPNPQQDPDRCSRTQKSFLCDPDHILSQDDGLYLITRWRCSVCSAGVYAGSNYCQSHVLVDT